ncbi:hypothetical protein DSM104443_00299 [Usitatibacter rugosus]|uniref:DUF4239 domain-containing protein n=1 Tax=Usitatibacter rugosus TaxID=2732067 RepID=A0A6M4GQ12_9PROT|nr:DUF4239 domain-containing protein [Usitatibacter rugosus]QJR09262.1 hypothetical protein DSM104443_00299 [Usitatibacter rugosus]
MIDFLFSLPLWALALVLNVWLVGFSLASVWAYRRWILPRLRIATDSSLFFAAATMQSGMVLYGLVAALTAVSVWSTHSQVKDTVSREATAIGGLWRDLGGYPQIERDAMRDVLRGYTNQIIQEAWPEQRQGRIPRMGVEWLDRFQVKLFAFEPTLESQKILHAETLGAYNRLVEARRQRLDAVGTGLPGVMWFALLPGAMGCLLLSLFFPVEDGRFQAILMAGLSGFVAMVLFVIISLDRPFHGAMAIPSDSYQLVYDQLMKK